MDRRTFIKGLIGAAVAIGLPIEALAQQGKGLTVAKATGAIPGARRIPQELLDDCVLDLEAFVFDQMGRVLSYEVDREFLYGTGDCQPTGFLDGIDLDELYDDGTFDGCNDYVNAYDDLPEVTVKVDGVDQGPGQVMEFDWAYPEYDPLPMHTLGIDSPIVKERFQKILAQHPEMERPQAFTEAILGLVGVA